MEDNEDAELKDLNHREVGWKALHWISSLALLLLLPSISTVLSFADEHYLSVFAQYISASYSILEVLFLRFPDGDGVENRTSRGTAWFLMVLTCFTAFVGSLISGSKFFFLKNKWKSGERSLIVLHRILSMLCLLTGWVRICLAVVALFGFCRDSHTGQCIAHGIMGTSFILYGSLLSIVLVLPWLRNGTNQKNSQEFYDSIVITVWGFVNTWTEHRWGKEPWSHSDYQHTSMGIIWWSGGFLGVFLSKNNQRSFIPSVILIFTGWAMSVHHQHLEISTKVHFFFGLSLMIAGLSRLIEINFVLNNQRSISNKILPFQYLPCFFLVESGLLFMGANEQQLELVNSLHADHSAYIMVLSSGAFLIYFWVLLLLEIYLYLVGIDKLSGQDCSNGSYQRLDENSTHTRNDIELESFSDNEAGSV
ncbi:Ytp1p ASCRUDRAFT_8083 [Ascoidea rubescens DSM 1968]|uniref:Protein YTP1-like C-terminal domain-containing protein n=1 Tax=Ascoidea rubescens DSM 1968 TaxID=1344418 RepID=A0A1D2VI20_9ASCO|nr:hypothetical protein ASCRUDRAFT_8083 [Ascoidea rubescens DSM 1968]ODV61133.1 hypothetical protein ASCRUDRAFT_8083 [Ascoidea rubescens DSM 1968]